jgi:AAA-like domain/CHAT domain
MPSPSRRKRLILFLAANPQNSTPLRLDQEVKEIEEGLQRSQKRNCFQLEQKWAVTARDVQRSMLDFKPQIVHFSGHGVGQAGLALEDASGQVKLVSGESLAKLFKLFADRGVECVVLNACYSEVQAIAIAEHIPYVIGMSQAVGDAAAREFAVGFYDALGAGESIEFAFENGCISISMAGIPEDLTPVLRRKSHSGDSPAIQSLISSVPEQVPSGTSRKLELDNVEPMPSPVLPPSAPLSLDIPEGLVSLDSQLYIDRPPIEENCYETILRPGALIRIKAPRQMGKSSLMQRVLQHANQHGHQTAYINFQSVDADFLTTLDQFLQWFCATVTDALGLEDKLETQWKGILGSKNKCTNYFQRYLLKQISSPLTLGLDEVDQVFQHLEIADGFFSLLRVWHENGKNDDVWKKFHLVIAHSKEVYIPLNINQSPFNVGLPVELPELNSAQITELVRRHQLNWSDRQVQQLKNVVDGHPYLLRKALYEIASDNLTLERFLEIAATDEGPFYEHLHRHLINLMNDPELEAAMKTVIASDEAVRIDPTQGFKLRSMGLVELRGSDVIPLCNLYRDYFRDQLGVRA